MTSCIADHAKLRVQAAFPRPVDPVFPYLNRLIPNAIYNQRVPSLTFTREHRLITLFSTELFLGKIANSTEAFQLLDEIKDLINHTHSRQQEIKPLWQQRRRPSTLELYAALPQTNCGRCGEKTCLALAAKVLLGQQEKNSCLILLEEGYQQQLAIWQSLVGDI
jgi:ArsR family metal-binding transcriptional regulator